MSGSRSRLPRRAAASDQDTACPEIARKCEATVGLERPLGKPGGLFSCIAVHFNRGAAGSSLTWLEDRNEQRPTEDRRGVPLDHRTGSLQSQPATVSGAATIGLDTGTFPPSALLHFADPLRDHRHRPHLCQSYPRVSYLRQSYLCVSYLGQSYPRQPQRPPCPRLRRLLLGPTLRLSQQQRTLPMR